MCSQVPRGLAGFLFLAIPNCIYSVDEANASSVLGSLGLWSKANVQERRKEKKNPFKQKKCSWVIRDWESKLKLWMWSLASVPGRAAFRATGPGNFQATFDKLAPLWFAFTPHNKLHLPLSLERQNNPLKGVYFGPTTRLKKDPKGICTWDESPCLGLGGILGRHLAPCVYHRGIHYWHTHVSL